MGMVERALASSSTLRTCLRIVTKWDESFSAASAERWGAQRLFRLLVSLRFRQEERDLGLKGWNKVCAC
jgi:hypothetical protein